MKLTYCLLITTILLSMLSPVRTGCGQDCARCVKNEVMNTDSCSTCRTHYQKGSGCLGPKGSIEGCVAYDDMNCYKCDSHRVEIPTSPTNSRIMKCLDIKPFLGKIPHCVGANMINGQVYCETCGDRYIPEEGKCTEQIQLIPHCLWQSEDSFYRCEKCEEGYTFDIVNSKCVRDGGIIPVNCSQFYVNICYYCIEGYYSSIDDKTGKQVCLKMD